MTLYHDRRVAALKELSESISSLHLDNPQDVAAGILAPIAPQPEPIRETTTATNMR